jgi:hypothetical protein
VNNPGRWQAADPEAGAPRPGPADARDAAEPGADVDLVAVEHAEPQAAEARGGTVEIEAVLTEDEYRQLLAAAAEAGKTPNDFLRQAVRDAWFFRRNAPPGSKILIVSGGKVHTVR